MRFHVIAGTGGALLSVCVTLTPFSTAATQQSRACWLVTPAEAAQILSRPELASGDVMRDGYQDCDYLRAGFDVHIEHVRTVAHVRESLKQDIKNNKVEAVAGVGDEAGFEKSDKQPSLIVIKGTHVVEATILMSRWKGSGEQVRPTLVKLAQAALARLMTPASAQSSRACWLVTPAEAAQILGKAQLKNGEAMHDDYDNCDYKGAGFDLDILNYTRAGARSDGFKNLVTRGFAEVVPDVGDQTILGRDAAKHSTVNVLKGSRELMITWLDSTQTSAADIKPKLVQLAKTAIARMH